MIGIDTNILVRTFINENEIQSHKALKLIQQQHPIYISAIVFCETIWVLKSRYNFNKTELMECVEKILKASHFHIQYRDAMWAAFHEFQHINADFSDCVIGAVAKLDACDAVMTFDKNAAKSKNFKLIK